MQFPTSSETENSPESLHHLRTIEQTRHALQGLRQSPDVVSDILSQAARRQTERLLARQLRLLGAAVVDAWRIGPDALRAFFGLESASATPTISLDLQSYRAPTASLRAANEVADPAMRPVAVTPDICKAIEERLRAQQAGGADTPEPSVTSGPSVDPSRLASLRHLLEQLGPAPTNVRGKRPAEREAERLEVGVAAMRHVADAIGREANHSVTSFVTARVRALQEAIAAHLRGADGAELSNRVERTVRALTAHSAKTQPGAVHGLNRNHKPKRASWADDALAAYTQLENLLPEMASKHATPLSDSTVDREATLSDAFRRLNEGIDKTLEAHEIISTLWIFLHQQKVAQTDPRLVGLVRRLGARLPSEALSAAGLADLARAACTNAANDDADHDESDDDTTSCRHRDETRGRHGVIVGGDRRPEREASIQKALGLASLKWVTTDQGLRQIDSLEERVKAGSVDFVFVLQRFVSHSISDRLFALRSDTCRVVLAKSYGVNAICCGLDRFLGQTQS
jgi:hypothetical protein